MEEKALICPSCSGQMKLAEAKPGDKIAKCEYCNTIVDLPDAAEKQGFDLNSLLNGMDLSNFKNSSTTVTSTTVIMKNGKVVNSDGNNDKIFESVNEILKKSGVHIDGLTDNADLNPTNEINANVKVQEENKPEEKKSFFKQLFRK